jgi:hypothetical protein
MKILRVFLCACVRFSVRGVEFCVCERAALCVCAGGALVLAAGILHTYKGERRKLK